MAAILQLVFRYILLGIATAVTFVADYFYQSDIPATSTPSITFEAPTEKLDFFFDVPSVPVVSSTAPQVEVSIPKIEVKPIETKPVVKPINVTARKPIEQPKQAMATSTAPQIKETSKSESLPIEAVTIEDAVINIICVETMGNLTRTTTGSGSIISPNGIIVTNAHVAIDFMKPNINCTIRTRTPAKNAYKAELLYIPDAWIEHNKEYVTSGIAHVTTGEYDFALLAVTSSATSAPLPKAFAYIKPSYEKIKVGDDISAVGYPAERTGLFADLSHLYRVSDGSEVKKIYSFGETASDVFSTGKVSNAEHGSSGGAIIKDGKLVGVIANVNSGTINALSMEYIQSYFEKDTDVSFLKISPQSSVQ